ncbi:hypothetical protein RYX36_007427 [Vicia faba]
MSSHGNDSRQPSAAKPYVAPVIALQIPEYVHSTIARCLGIPQNNVRVITRRAGGTYGGKSMKSIAGDVSCALAAHKLQRPVRMYLNRKIDMLMVGGRHSMKITYSIGFKNNGKFTALHLEVLVGAGIYPDLTKLCSFATVHVKKWLLWGYWVSPMMYGYNVIVVNEFLGKSWSYVPLGSIEELGVQILKSRGIFPEAYWYWIGTLISEALAKRNAAIAGHRQIIGLLPKVECSSGEL